jgi:two-component system, OmpR family, response regulator
MTNEEHSRQRIVRVLVIDDEPQMIGAIGVRLRDSGFEVIDADSGAAGLAVLGKTVVDLVVLDAMMPGLGGLDVLRWLRAAGLLMPVLLLTAENGGQHVVDGLRLGADDCLAKPFCFEELAARIDALLRRVIPASQRGNGSPLIELDPAASTLRFADLAMNEDTHEVWRSGQQVVLTALEFRLLHYFLRRPRQVLAKRELMRDVWNYDIGGDPNVVETYISYLRKKLDHGRVPLLHTVRGAGYILREPPVVPD